MHSLPVNLIGCLYVLVLLFTRTCEVRPCGTSTHISIAHEAFTFFKGNHHAEGMTYEKLLEKHQDAFVAGNPYPDAMYPSICFGGKYHDTAEDTHWAPFLNATINYVRNHYPQPWDEETEKLVAFMFGFVSHQVADITWHSLGIDQGLIRTMANLNFNGIYDKAHTDADVGGDMLTQLYQSDQTITTSSWYVPSGDLYNIYKYYYHGNKTIPKMVIEACSELLYIEYIAEKLAGAKIFKPFVKNSPFFYNHMENYFLGGIHDMAAWTEKIWQEVIFMLENGTSDCNMKHNSLFMNCTGYLPSGLTGDEKSRNPGRRHSLLADGWTTQHVLKKRTTRGIYYSPGNILKKEIKRKNKQSFEKNAEVKEASDNKYSYSQSGREITTIELAGEEFVVISAPTYSDKGMMLLGKVWVIPANELNSQPGIVDLPDLDEIAVSVLYGNESMSKFGWSMAVTYFNDDEYQDLLISAPITGSKQLNYNGAIFIYFGSKTGFSNKPDSCISNIRNETSNTTFANFGYTLVGDLNTKGFVMTGNPFYPSRVTFQQNGIAWTRSETFFEWFRIGYNDFTWFGYSLIHRVLPDGTDITVVGSPTHRICHLPNCSYSAQDQQSVGYVSTFLLYEESAYLSGTEEYEEFGSALAIGKPYIGDGSYVLAISSPGKTVTSKVLGVSISLRQAGMVQVYNVTDLDDPEKRQLLATFYGDRAYGRFGEKIQFKDMDGDGVDEFIVSAPRRSRDFTEEIYGGGEGAVYVFKLSSTADDVTNCPVFGMIPCPGAKSWRYFEGEEAHARFGTSFQVITVRNTTQILVSSPTSSKYGFQAGLVQNIEI